jgi:signal transduction histidine kinase
MRDSIRANVRVPVHPRRHSVVAALTVNIGLIAGASPAFALNSSTLTAAFTGAALSFDRHEIAALAVMLGILGFAVVTAILLVRTRARAQRAAMAARAQTAALKAELDRVYALLLAEPQAIIAWSAGEEKPEILGHTTIVTPNPVPSRVLAFGTWLDPDRAQTLEAAVEALRARGEGFSMVLTTLSGRHIEAEGRAIGGRAVLRLKDLSGTKRQLALLQTEHRELLASIETLYALVEALPSPIWARDRTGQLVFANQAYARAVEANDGPEAVARRLELLDRSAREDLKRAIEAGERYAARVPVIIAGTRRILNVVDMPTRGGSGGIGIDVTEVETLRGELAHMVNAHRRILDQLSTAVATFGANQRLTFYNAAYRRLWGLDPAFLDQQPTDSAVLDQLRAARKLPEQADFRQWKAQLHEAYRALEPQEHWWHLPDGRTLRVVTTPDPEGGVTYLFDDVTERLELERRHDSLIRVQSETLDNLAEAVAVFASDGRLRLFNPAFSRMWNLAPANLAERPHIETIIGWCQPLHDQEDTWTALRSAITGLGQRTPILLRLDRRDGSVVNCSTVPLPDGATLVTFQDVTDTVNVERALRDRAEALEAADALKNDFVHHVSYELRSPLTNIIGFAQLLADTASGPLTDKQREYLGYITTSSAALLAIINDILDLATIDAGAMTLDIGPVDVRKAMQAAAEGVKDRLAEHNIRLEIQAPSDIGGFRADERRLRQVLFNLLSNAIGFSPPGETVTLLAERQDNAMVFSVIDRGPGIPEELKERIFNRFESHPRGSRHHGAGLGLSIVRSLVELHGGRVCLRSEPGRGTIVQCIFPLDQPT